MDKIWITMNNKLKLQIKLVDDVLHFYKDDRINEMFDELNKCLVRKLDITDTLTKRQFIAVDILNHHGLLGDVEDLAKIVPQNYTIQ